MRCSGSLLKLAAVLLVLVAGAAGVLAEEITLKRFNDPGLGGEAVLKEAVLVVDDAAIEKRFTFQIGEPGMYVIAAWVRPGSDEQVMEVSVDGVTEGLSLLETGSAGWQSAFIGGVGEAPATFSLAKGDHSVTFRRHGSVAPDVDLVRAARDAGAAAISDAAYRELVASLGSGELPAYHFTKKEIPESAVLGQPRLGKGALGPQSDYIYDLNFSFTYTYYGYFSLTAGQPVTFETVNADPNASDPVMFLFYYASPASGTWSDDDGGAGLQSKITCTPPATGTYMVVLRGFANSSGTSDLYKDGSLVASNVIIGGRTSVAGILSKTGTLNHFTTRLTGDSRLWAMDNSSHPGLVKGQADDYYGSGDWSWGLASRIHQTISPAELYVLVGAYSSSSPSGTCDVYQQCSDSTIGAYFPNLKSDDAIQSAPSSDAYNCISWSGGRADLGRYFWPPNAGNPWQGTSDLASFDNFYGNTKNGQTLVRFNGAMNYTRSGATSANSAVDLWAASGMYTHGSVNTPGDSFPHGYDWESKPGGLARTFHPRNALSGPSYGSVVAYYRWDGTYSYGTPPMKQGGEPVVEELPLESVAFSSADLGRLAELVQAVPKEMRASFDERYEAWRATWSDPELQIQSNPRMFARSPEYFALLDYCERQGRAVWPLVLSRLVQADELAIDAIEDLTFSSYSGIMDEILEDNLKHAASVIPSQAANWNRYAIRLIDAMHAEYRKAGALD